MDCIFCKIVSEEIPCNKVYEDENVLAFDDISPAAPVHVLVVPKKHVDNASEISKLDNNQIAALHRAVEKVAEIKGVQGAFRLISNCGTKYGQTVHHLHYHVLGGGKISFPE